MADTKLSQLTELAVEPADTDEIYVNDGGTSKRITYGTLKTALLNRANHTGTDSTSIISGLTEVTVAAGDYIMVLDVSTSPISLKKILASDFATAAQANATHTGDVTGATALTLQPVAISGQTSATASGSDYVLILDTSDSPNSLKKALVSDLGSAFGVSDITGAGAITVAGTDLLVAVDTSASPQVLGQVTAQAVANLFDASGYLPLSGGTMTGDIAFAASSPEHTVDGRNISADGAKLDGIEAGADVTDTANVTAAGALMDSEVTNLAAVKAFDPADYATAAQANATHTGDAVGATSLTLQPAAITGKGAVTVAGADHVLVVDDSASPQTLGKTTAQAVADLAKPTESIIVACSDETTALTTGTAKVTFRMPYAFTLSEVRATVTTAPVGSSIIVDINEKVGTPSPDVGTSILSTRLYIDAGEFSSEDASVSPAHQSVISDTSLADDAEITIDIDQIGASTAGAGLKVELIGKRT